MFKLGDMVEWDSGGAPGRYPKCGKIVAVVLPNESPTNAMDAQDIIGYYMMFNGGPRLHISYLVLVGNKLYWPRVKGLKKVEGA